MDKFYCNKCKKDVVLQNGECPYCETNWDEIIKNCVEGDISLNVNSNYEDDYKSLKYFDYGYFVISLLSVIISYLNIKKIIYTHFLFSFSMIFTMVCGFIYLIGGCLLYNHKKKILYFIDSLFCICLLFVWPYPIFVNIYEYSEHLYYFLGAVFSLLPLAYCYIEKVKVDFRVIIKSLTRICMILLIIFLILFLQSCSFKGLY